MADPDLERFYSDLAALDVTGLQGPPGPDGANTSIPPIPGANGLIAPPGPVGVTNVQVPSSNYFNGNPGNPGWYAVDQKAGLAGRNGTNGTNRPIIYVLHSAIVSSGSFTLNLIYTRLYYVYFHGLSGGTVTISRAGFPVPYLTITSDFHDFLWLQVGDVVTISGVPAGYNTWAFLGV